MTTKSNRGFKRNNSKAPERMGSARTTVGVHALTVALVLAGMATGARAQSSVSIYGVLDDGIAYSSNVGGSRLTKAQNSGSWSNSFGFSGTEDLGGGTKAIFRLNSAFNLNTGQLGNNGALFGNRAYVGLTNKGYGTLTLGRQFDFAADLLDYVSAFGTTIFAFHPGGYDRISGVSLSNAVRYESPVLAGFQAKAMYAFGDANGGTNTRRSNSFELNYKHAGFSVIAVMTSVGGTSITPTSSMGTGQIFGQALSFTSNPTVMLKDLTIYLGGVQYKTGDFSVSGTYSDVVFTSANGMQKATMRTPELVATWYAKPNVLLSVGVWQSRLDESRWNTLNVGCDYFFSKRTDVMLAFNLQRVSGPRQYASFYTLGNSSNQNQAVLYTGIRHRF